MNRIQKLNILNAMYYERTELSIEDLFSLLPKAEVGFDCIAVLSFQLKEELLEIKAVESGIHPYPPSIEPDRPENPDGMLSIKTGTYLFMQLPKCPIDRLKLELLPFINGRKEGYLFLRLIKENLFEEVMQFIMPI